MSNTPEKQNGKQHRVRVFIFLHIQGMYYQIGDIVSLVDHDMSVYYAQIRGFMQDQYNEKSAVISWLLPTQGTSQEDYFDPTTYILGR
jgi:hypothetical protein